MLKQQQSQPARHLQQASSQHQQQQLLMEAAAHMQTQLQLPAVLLLRGLWEPHSCLAL
jgi:hypothetical protein